MVKHHSLKFNIGFIRIRNASVIPVFSMPLWLILRSHNLKVDAKSKQNK